MATPVPVFVEIAPGAQAAGDPSGAAFTDVTTSVFQVADQIVIGQGRGDWGQDADAGTCSATFRNASGDYSEHNPLGQWYGLLGKDTPMRCGLRRVEDTFSRTTTAEWGTSDSLHTWAGFGFGGSVLSTDVTVSGGLGRQSIPVAAAFRGCWITNLSLLDCRVRLRGIALPFSDVTGGSVEPGNILLRAQSISTYYLARIEVTTAEAVICRLFNPAGTELANATVAGLTHSAAQTLEAIAEITGDVIRMKVWATAAAEPSGWAVSATDASLALPGSIGVRTGVGSGNTNAKPIVATYDSLTVYVDLFGGWVPAWVPRSDISGKSRRVPVSAKGALYRAIPATGKSLEVSPYRRTITAMPKLLGYWPCEDLDGSTQVASAIPGGAPMTVTGTVDFAGDPAAAGGSGFERDFSALGWANRVPPGTKALPNLAAGARLSGPVPRVGTSTPVEWSVCFVARSNSLQAGKEILLVEWDTPGGTYTKFRLYQKVAGTVELFGIDPAGVGFSLGNWTDFSVVLTEYRVEAVTAGGGATIRIYVDGLLKANNTFGATTFARVTSVAANPLQTSVTGVSGWWIGHIQAWDTATPPTLGLGDIFAGTTDGYSQTVQPFFRWLNETGHDRLKRLIGQDNVPVFVPPVTADLVTRMGAQPDGSPLDLYRECERTDDGVLYERPFALGYVPRAALYSQTPALALTTADLTEAPAPDGSGQRYRNRWQVTRPTGSSAVADAPEIAQGAIVNDEAEEINTAVDAVLRDQADWRLHLVSGRELRWPTLKFDPWRSSQLLDRWLNCRSGSRITVAGPTADVADQDIDVILEGSTITLRHKSIEVSANCSPAKPWEVGIADGAQLAAADGTVTLAATLALGAMSCSLASAATGGLWTTDATDFPQDVWVGGEKITLSIVTGSTSPQTGTISARGLNGVTRAWPTGTNVDVVTPAVAALGGMS